MSDILHESHKIQQGITYYSKQVWKLLNSLQELMESQDVQEAQIFLKIQIPLIIDLFSSSLRSLILQYHFLLRLVESLPPFLTKSIVQ